MTTENEPEPTRRFTDMRTVETPDERIQFTSCLECGTCIVIDPEDRKKDIHPIGAHIEWHDNLVVWFEKVDALEELLTGAIPKKMAEGLPKAAEPGTTAPKP